MQKQFDICVLGGASHVGLPLTLYKNLDFKGRSVVDVWNFFDKGMYILPDNAFGDEIKQKMLESLEI